MKLAVANIPVRQDAEGRICLNDLHKAAVASGLNQRTKEPGKFFANQQTTELIAELETTQNSGSCVVTMEGRNGGTFVCRDLAYAYAMWISPAFFLKVVHVYDLVATSMRGQLPAHTQTVGHYESEYARLQAEMERLEVTPICMTPAEYREMNKPYVVAGSHHVRMVDLIGMTEAHGVPRKAVENLLGITNNNTRQHASRARKAAA